MRHGPPTGRRYDPNGVRRFLFAAVNPDRTDRDVALLLEGADPAAIVVIARHQRVAALLHHRLTGLDTPAAAALAAHLRRDMLMTRARQMQTHATIARLRSALAVPFLILKGPALAQQWYSEPSLRMYVDVDVLVRSTDFRAACEMLTGSELTHLLPSWDGLLARGMAEVPLRHQVSTVDLHWHLIARPGPRRAIALDLDAMFERAVTLTIGAVDVATLDNEDTLLHLCVHSGLDGGRRLQQLVDVDRVIRSGRIDWDIFVERTHRAKAHALCSAIILRCRELIATPLPQGLLRQLQPFHGWEAINSRVNRHPRPDRRIFDGIASGIVVAAGRATLAATVAAGMRAVWEAARQRGPHVQMPGLRHATGGQVDDPQSRRRYLAWVDAHAAIRS